MCSSLVYTGELFVLITNLPAMATPQEKNISPVTLDWPEGEKEAVEQYEEVYNHLTCRCEKAN